MQEGGPDGGEDQGDDDDDDDEEPGGGSGPQQYDDDDEDDDDEVWHILRTKWWSQMSVAMRSMTVCICWARQSALLGLVLSFQATIKTDFCGYSSRSSLPIKPIALRPRHPSKCGGA